MLYPTRTFTHRLDLNPDRVGQLPVLDIELWSNQQYVDVIDTGHGLQAVFMQFTPQNLPVLNRRFQIFHLWDDDTQDMPGDIAPLKAFHFPGDGRLGGRHPSRRVTLFFSEEALAVTPPQDVNSYQLPEKPAYE